MSVYYNENDPEAVAWLRELMFNKVIPWGLVDERSIEDVRPDDLRGFKQCHFFAGIGGWAEALHLVGWPADREVWTGSCPCQPFSAAGKGGGFADERHLWPAWFHLIEECRPSVVFGEQVDAAIKFGWLDLVQSDMEGIGYAFASVVIPAASVGAPHGRHRAYFVAESDSERREGLSVLLRPREPRADQPEITGSCATGVLVEPSSEQMGIPGRARFEGVTAGFWSRADWIPCVDQKWRPVEPGTFPLAHGIPARMGRLRGYGNAIVPQVAAEFIIAYANC